MPNHLQYNSNGHLLKNNGHLMNECCCEPIPDCNDCDPALNNTYTCVVAGLQGPCMSLLNGTYTVTWNNTLNCFWEYRDGINLNMYFFPTYDMLGVHDGWDFTFSSGTAELGGCTCAVYFHYTGGECDPTGTYTMYNQAQECDDDHTGATVVVS